MKKVLSAKGKGQHGSVPHFSLQFKCHFILKLNKHNVEGLLALIELHQNKL